MYNYSTEDWGMLRKALKQRKEKLDRLLNECTAWMKGAPSGSMNVCCSRGCPSFVLQPGTKHLSKRKDAELIENLALKDYYSKLIPVIEEEIAAIDVLLSLEEKETIPMVYESLHPERQKLVKQIENTRKQLIDDWNNLEEIPSEPRSGSYYIPTDRGELVRSKNEFQIANALFRAGIPYKYEYPYEATNGKTLHPDFYVINPSTGQTYYWEHFGMMDDSEYVMNSFMYKIKLYSLGGLVLGKNLIATFSCGAYPIDRKTIDITIKSYLR